VNRSLGLALLLALVTAAPSSAQEARLVQRLGAPAADSIARIIDAAEREGLPRGPLNAKALEGAGRGAPPGRVIQAVMNLVSALRTARTALGDTRSPDELAAGAAAVQNGATSEELRELARASGARSVALPLVVLTDLVSRGVPSDTISPLLVAAWRRGVSEADLLRLRETISRDISAGATPWDAAILHLRTLAGSPALPPRTVTPGVPRP
jgi:hypothetical protein